MSQYTKNIVSEPYIKSFLDLKVTRKNYNKKIDERTKKIAEEYAKIYKKLYDELII